MGDKWKKQLYWLWRRNSLQSGVMAKTTASESGVCKTTMGDKKNNQAEIEKWCTAKTKRQVKKYAER